MRLPTKKEMRRMDETLRAEAKHATLSEKALYVIDCLLSEVDEVNTDPLLGKIYEAAHGCNRLSCCYSSHEDWRQATLERFNKELKCVEYPKEQP